MLQNRRFVITRESWRKFWLLFFLTVLILFGTYHPVFSLMAFVLCGMTIVFVKQSFVISLMFFIMPMAGIFKLAPQETSLFTYLELLYVAMHIYKKKFRITYGELITFLFGAYIFITASLYEAFSITRSIKLVMNLLLLGYIAELDPKREHKRLFLHYIFGLLVSSLMRFADSAFFPIAKYVEEQLESYGGMTTVRFSGLYPDPNYYSINLIIGMCLLIVLYRRKELKLSTVVGLMASLVFFVGLTGSKSSFLMLILPITLLMYVCIKNRNYLALFGCIFGMVLVAFFVIQGSIPLFNYVLLRLGNITSGMDAFTTGRTAIWREYIQFLKDNPMRTIFGTGASIAILNYKGSHNTYIDFVYLFGIVGAGLYIVSLCYNLRKLNRRIHRNFVNYSVFLTIGIMYAFISELQFFDLPFHVALAGMAWNLENENNSHG